MQFAAPSLHLKISPTEGYVPQFNKNLQSLSMPNIFMAMLPGESLYV